MATQKSQKRINQTAVIKAFFKLVEKYNWDEITLSKIADEAGVTVSRISKMFRSKNAILNAYNEKIDDLMLKNITQSKEPSQEQGRDFLFDILMSRFDLINPDRVAITKIIRQVAVQKPLTSLLGLIAVKNTMRLVLKSIDNNRAGMAEGLRLRVLVLIYMKTMLVWIRDDSKDLTKTMAALDQSLAKVEEYWNLIPCTRDSKYGNIF